MYGDWARTVVLVSAGCLVTLTYGPVLVWIHVLYRGAFASLSSGWNEASTSRAAETAGTLKANIFMNTSHRMYFGLTTWINAWIGSWIVAWWNSRAIAAEWQRQPTFTFTHCTLHNWCQKGMTSLQIILSYFVICPALVRPGVLAQASVLLSHQISSAK